MASISDSPGAPDWSAIDRDIVCPLCDYNLRGLAEPRCPECGHRSNWVDLLDPQFQKHPWLFEHRPFGFQLLPSFVRTLWYSQFPRWFWKAVNPLHRPRAGRLFLYWCLMSALLVMVMGGPYFLGVGNYYDRVRSARAQISSGIQQSNRPPMPKAQADARAAQMYPYPSPWKVWGTIEVMMPSLYRVAGHLCLVLLLWPSLTILSLLIFRQTLAQARIRTLHVVRCAVYSADAALVWGWPIAWLMAMCIDPITGMSNQRVFFTPWFLIPLLVTTALFTYRLSCAYRDYLRFPAPVWTCVASQVIVMLAFLAMMPWVIMF